MVPESFKCKGIFRTASFVTYNKYCNLIQYPFILLNKDVLHIYEH